ncbi:unnamed protein product [Paramecium sonneborni]|uniref:Phosphoribosyltransferase domain-containing protein n=1 Tax=Paramecium sonneborni TaxID=65129 RepID=A0A8S1NN21_9CILI|nr:unnamed protein product [Paramecium sonneborni]
MLCTLFFIHLSYRIITILSKVSQSDCIRQISSRAYTAGFSQHFRLYQDRLIILLFEKVISEHIKKINGKIWKAFLGKALKVFPGKSVGFIFVQEHSQTKDPQLIYCKLPEDVDQKQLTSTDAMIRTGDRIKKLQRHGYHFEQIKIIQLQLMQFDVRRVSQECYIYFRKQKQQHQDLIMPQIQFKIYDFQVLEIFGNKYFGTVDQQ